MPDDFESQVTIKVGAKIRAARSDKEWKRKGMEKGKATHSSIHGLYSPWYGKESDAMD